MPPRPEVTVFPSVPDPYQQLPSIAISVLALLVSIYALKKTLSQKRNEHRANFFHEVVVSNAIHPLVTFYEELTIFCTDQSTKLPHSIGTGGHDNEVRQAMRHVRDAKRATAARICGLVSPFSTNLEQMIQSEFDTAADYATEFLDIYASGSTSEEPIGRLLSICQRNTIELLREHEFNLGWPSRSLIRRFVAWLFSITGEA